MSGLTRSALAGHWQRLSARERVSITLAICLAGLALLWRVGLAPAWQTWRDTASRHAVLDRQQAELQTLQVQARALQARSVPSRGEALQSLTQLTRDRMPGAQLSALGDQQRITLKGVPAADVAQWLAAVRQTVQASVLELKLQRSATSPDKPPQWDGHIVVQLPQRGAP